MTSERAMGTLRPEGYARRRRVVAVLADWFEAHGYLGIDLPVLESTDLYLRKAGSEILAMLYSFVEPGGRRVSLRPEFTASAVRCYLDGPAGDARWHYNGPVFRYDSAMPKAREQYQQGIEHIGAAGASEDAALLTLARDGLARLGIVDATVDLGHVGVFAEAISAFGLSDRAQSAVLSSISLLTRPGGAAAVRDRLVELGLAGETTDRQAELRASLADLGEERSRAVIHGLLDSINIDLSGQREPNEIVERLLRKFSGWDEPATLERAIRFATELAAISGPPAEAIDTARSVLAAWGAAAPAIDDLAAIVESIDNTGVTVTFGLDRDLGYYSGMVFEIRHPNGALGGGGRYDALIRALGGGDTPAAGFAYNVDALCQAVD